MNETTHFNGLSIVLPKGLARPGGEINILFLSAIYFYTKQLAF